MNLELCHVRKPLSEFALEVNERLEGKRTSIFGPSGAGKTSLLEIIAGLRDATCDLIRFNQITFADSRYVLAVRHRRVGYVPQYDSLFPHRNVRQNLLYGRRPASHRPVFSFDHVADFLQLNTLLARDVRHLSRGERQRVTIGRALLSEPCLLLLDEPLTGLDGALRTSILEQLRKLPDEFDLPMLYVTHDRDEAIELCDEVLLLDRGKVIGRGPPARLLG